jgi:cell division inhibitor SepF
MDGGIMGFLDNIRDRFRRDDDYDDYEDDYYDGDDEQRERDRERGYGDRRPTGSATKLLGNTSRPEAESVSVYTRSGRPVTQNPAAAYADQRDTRPRPSYVEPPEPTYRPAYEPPAPSPAPTAPADLGRGGSSSRVTSGQLPPYVLRPVSYDDVQSVVRRVRTNQPVILIFRGTNIETAKRILDFCYGLSYGVSGSVEALGDRVFAVLPAGIELTQGDIDKLVVDGDLEA